MMGLDKDYLRTVIQTQLIHDSLNTKYVACLLLPQIAQWMSAVYTVYFSQYKAVDSNGIPVEVTAKVTLSGC